MEFFNRAQFFKTFTSFTSHFDLHWCFAVSFNFSTQIYSLIVLKHSSSRRILNPKCWLQVGEWRYQFPHSSAFWILVNAPWSRQEAITPRKNKSSDAGFVTKFINASYKRLPIKRQRQIHSQPHPPPQFGKVEFYHAILDLEIWRDFKRHQAVNLTWQGAWEFECG